MKVPDAESQLISQVATFVSTLRNEDLEKKPGIAETIDWLRALIFSGIGSLSDNTELIKGTLSCLIKTSRDRANVSDDILEKLLG